MNRHRYNVRAGPVVPWPSLRRFIINCTASLARDLRELQQAYAVCASSAVERCTVPNAFHEAMNGLQFACLHGFFHDRVHDFVVNFNNFSSEGFLLSVNFPILNIHGLMEWAAEGMIFNGICLTPRGGAGKTWKSVTEQPALQPRPCLVG